MSPTFEQHVKYIELVFDALRAGGIHLKAKKCNLGSDVVKCLGHVISEKGITPDTEKTRIIEFQPTSRADITSFHGMCSFYRKFVKNFSDKAKPLTVFINSRKPFKGITPELQEAINLLKSDLVKAPIIAHPDFSLPFEVHCDASPFALGATLVQRVEGGEKIIMYISRSLKGHEQKYMQFERELLAVVWATAVFRPYTIGCKFNVVTDNKAVSWLNTSTHTNPRLMRWMLSLNTHRITYVHRPGKQHVVPDALSRAFHVPSDVVYEKNDDVDALCVMRIVDSEKRESYILPEREQLITAQKSDLGLANVRGKFEKLSDAEKLALQTNQEGFFLKDDILFRRVTRRLVFVEEGEQ